MRALDLFSGLGCSTLAMREAGVEVVAAAERDPWRVRAYEEHHGEHVPLIYADVNDCIEAHPGVDLWAACVAVAALETLVDGHDTHLPTWLWLESVREPFASLQAVCSRHYPSVVCWDACGRRHLVAGPREIDLSFTAEYAGLRLQHPELDLRRGVSFEVQEERLGLPAGWTAAAGATAQQRRGALASASHAGMLRAVARRIAG